MKLEKNKTILAFVIHLEGLLCAQGQRAKTKDKAEVDGDDDDGDNGKKDWRKVRNFIIFSCG